MDVSIAQSWNPGMVLLDGRVFVQVNFGRRQQQRRTLQK